jgi:OmpA-OmpF porin, OOP family
MNRITLMVLALSLLGGTLLAAVPRNGSRAASEEFVVRFGLNSTRLTESGLVMIRHAAARATEVAATRVEVTGHADLSGSTEYNLWLSRRRTETVLQALKQAGVATVLLHADWKGEFAPLPNSSAGADSINRRVTIVVIY